VVLLVAVGLGVLAFAAALAWANRPDALTEERVESQPTAYLKFTAEEDWSPCKTSLYARTQLQLVSSPMVVNVALRGLNRAELPVLPERRDDAADWLRSRLLVDRPGDAAVIRIRIANVPRDQAAKIVNAVTNAYLGEIVNKERDDALVERDKLQAQAEKLEREIFQLYQSKVRLEVKQRSDALTVKLARAAMDDFIKERSELTREARKLVRQIKFAKARANDAPPEGLAAAEEELKFLLKSREELQSELSDRAAELAKLEAADSLEYMTLSTRLDDLAPVRRELSRQLRERTIRLETFQPRVVLLQLATAPAVP
jgi:hypothetical protein